MQIDSLHSWDVKPKDARAKQKLLASEVRIEPLQGQPRTLAACDVSFNRGSNLLSAAVAIFDFNDLTLLEEQVASLRIDFPYIPGFLSFRELPVILKAMEGLSLQPDIILCDGQGIAHPARLGIASHLGVWLGLPTVGCAKSKLCGDYEEPGLERGDSSPLMHKGEKIGDVLRTKRAVQPLFVSPGHLCDFADARDLVLRLAPRYRLPLPIRHVHELSNEARRAAMRDAEASPSLMS